MCIVNIGGCHGGMGGGVGEVFEYYNVHRVCMAYVGEHRALFI